MCEQIRLTTFALFRSKDTIEIEAILNSSDLSLTLVRRLRKITLQTFGSLKDLGACVIQTYQNKSKRGLSVRLNCPSHIMG